jgi:hypothetical protein
MRLKQLKAVLRRLVNPQKEPLDLEAYARSLGVKIGKEFYKEAIVQSASKRLHDS